MTELFRNFQTESLWRTNTTNSTHRDTYTDSEYGAMMDYYNYGNNRFPYIGDNINDMHTNWIRTPHFIPTATLYGLTFLLGLTGNCVVVFAILGERKARTVTSTFMISLAAADILFLSICVPYELTRYVITTNLGDVMCKLSGLMEMVSAMASILNLSAVSVER